MRPALLVVGFALASAACQQRAPVGPPPEDAGSPVVEAVEVQRSGVQTVPSPDGSASLVYGDVKNYARVWLAAGADTTDVVEAPVASRRLGVEWLAPDLGRVWVPFGNYTYAVVYAEPSSGRVSPWFDFAAAVDAEAETVLTFDPDAVTLRGLWSGDSLAAWVPEGVSIYDLRHGCEPSFTLAGRSAAMRYDCGDGVREQAVVL